MTRLAKKINVLLLSLAFALTLVLGLVGLGAFTAKANADEPDPITTATIQADLNDMTKGIWSYTAESDITLDFAKSATEHGKVTQKYDGGYAIQIVGKTGKEKVTIKNLDVEACLGAIFAQNVNLTLENVTTKDVSDPGSEVYGLRVQNKANVKLVNCQLNSKNGVLIGEGTTVNFWGDKNTVTATEIAINKIGVLQTYGGTFIGQLRNGKGGDDGVVLAGDDIEYGNFSNSIDTAFARDEVTKTIGETTYYCPKNFEVTAESEETTSYSTIEDALAGGNALNKDFTVKFFIDNDYEDATSEKYFAKYIAVDSAKVVTIDLNTTTAKFDSYAFFDVAFNTANTSLTLKNGTVDAKQYVVWAQNGAKVNIAKDLVINANSENVSTSGAIAVVGTGTTLDVYGTVKSAGNFAISAVGKTADAGALINIKDGATVENTGDGVAIYLPSSKLVVDESTKTNIKGKTAIYVKGGEVDIKGGTIEGTGTKADVTFINGGFAATGDALVIESCGYPEGNPIKASVSGGTFISANAAPIASYATNGKEAKDRVMNFITGGYFKTTADASADPAVTAYTALGRPAAELFHIDTSVDNDGYACSYEPVASGTYAGFYETVAGHAYVAIEDGAGYRAYSSIREAIDTVKANETIKVYDSHTISADIDANTDLAYNLDLNGKTVTGNVGSGGNWAYLTFKKGIVTVSNGTLNKIGVVVTGTSKVTFNSDAEKPLNVVETASKYALQVTGGEAIVNGGTFTRASSKYYVLFVAGGKITVNGGDNPATFNGGAYISGGYTEIKGGKFVTEGDSSYSGYSLYALYITFTEVETTKDILVTGGTFESKNDVAVKSNITGEKGKTDDASTKAAIQFIDMCSESSNKAAPSTTMKNFKSFGGVLGNPANPTVDSAYLITPDSYKNPLAFIKEEVDPTNEAGVYYDTIQQTIAQILDTDGTTVKATYSVLQRAFNDVLDGETIQLIDSFNQASKLDVNTGKKFTFDINGEKLTATTGENVVLFDISNATNVTIVDSADTKGSISAKDAFANVSGAKSELTIDSTVTVTSDGTGIVATEGTKVTVNGSLTTEKLAVDVKGAGSKLIIGASATVTSKDAGIVAAEGANVSILGKLTTDKLAIDVKGSVLLIEDSATVTSSDAGIVAADGANVRIFGALTSEKLAIDAKGTETVAVVGQGAKITVNSVKEHAIKVTEGATLRTGIIGDFKHTGITFITNTLVSTTSLVKGAVSAIYVEDAKFYAEAPDTIIDGANVALELKGGNNDVRITNGTFLTEGNEAKGAASIKVVEGNEHAFIVDGLFNVEPAANLFKEGKACSLEKNEDYLFYVVTENARVKGTDETGDYRYASLENAIKGATGKAEITLLNDVTETFTTKTSAEKITVDFNEKSNTGNITVSGGVDFIVDNGTNNGDFTVGVVSNGIKVSGVVIDEKFTINGTLYVYAKTTLKGYVDGGDNVAVKIDAAIANKAEVDGLTVEETATIISSGAQGILLSAGELLIKDDPTTTNKVAAISGKTAGIEAWEYTKLTIENAVVDGTDGPALLIDIQYADTDTNKTKVLVKAGIYTSDTGMAVVSKASVGVTPVSEFVAGEGIQFNSKTEEDAVKVAAQHIVAKDYFLYIPDNTELYNLKTTAELTEVNKAEWIDNYPDNSIVDGYTEVDVFSNKVQQSFYSIYLHKDVDLDGLSRHAKVHKGFVVNEVTYDDKVTYFIDNNEAIRLSLDLFIIETYKELLNTVKYGEYGKLMLQQVVAIFVSEIGGIPGVDVTPLIAVPTTFSGLANVYDMYINSTRAAYDNLLAVPDLQSEIKLAQDNLIKYYYDVNNLLTTLISDGYKFDKEAMLNKLVDVLDEINEMTYINAENTYEEILEAIDAKIADVEEMQFKAINLVAEYANSDEIKVTCEPEFLTAIRAAKNELDINIAMSSCIAELDKYKSLRDTLYTYAEDIKKNTADVVEAFKTTYCNNYNAMFEYLKGMNTTISSISTDVTGIKNELPLMKQAIIDQIKSAITEAKNAIIEDTEDIQAKLVTLSNNIGFENEKTLIQSIIAYKDEIKNYANALINDASTGAIAQIGAKITTAEGNIKEEIGKLKTYLATEIGKMEADLGTLKTNLGTLTTNVADDYADLLSKIGDAKTTITGILNDSTNGLAAINANVDAANTAIADVKAVVDDILATISEDLTDRLEYIKNTVDDIKTGIGYTDTTVITKIANAQEAISKILTEGDDSLAKINDNIDAANTAIGTVNGIVNEIKTSVGADLTGKVDALKTFIETDVKALLTDATNGLAAINANVDAAELAISNILNNSTYGLEALDKEIDVIDGIVDKIWASVGENLGSTVSTINTNLTNLINKMGFETDKTLVATLNKSISDAQSAIAAILNNSTYGLAALDTEIDTANTAIAGIRTVVDAIKTSVGEKLTERVDAIKTVVDAIKTSIGYTDTTVIKSINDAKDAINAILTNSTYGLEALDKEIDVIDGIVDDIKLSVGEKLNEKVVAVDTALNGLITKIGFEGDTTLVSTIKSAIKGAQDAITTLVTKETDEIDTALSNLSTQVTKATKDITDAIDTAKTAIVAKLNERLDTVDSTLSNLVAKIGFQEGKTLVETLLNAKQDIKDLVQLETDNIDAAIVALSNKITSMEENIKKAITDAKLALAADLKARLDRVDQSLFDDTAAIEKAIADADAAIEQLVSNETDDIDAALAQLKIDLAVAEENVENALALAEENITSLEKANHKADVDDRYANNTAILWIISIALGFTCAVIVLVIIVKRKR